MNNLQIDTPKTAGERYRAWVWPGANIHPEHVEMAEEFKSNAPRVQGCRKGDPHAIFTYAVNAKGTCIKQAGVRGYDDQYICFVMPNGDVVADPATWP